MHDWEAKELKPGDVIYRAGGMMGRIYRSRMEVAFISRGIIRFRDAHELTPRDSGGWLATDARGLRPSSLTQWWKSPREAMLNGIERATAELRYQEGKCREAREVVDLLKRAEESLDPPPSLG